MIKFFRKIRQKLLSENKLSKYLIYAIGEIILVVIGILIALQVNNLNENNKLNKRENDLLKELHTEFIKNKEQFNFTITGHQNVVENCNQIISMFPISINKTDLNLLQKYGGYTFYRFTFNPSQGIINSIINTSSFNIIKNDTLRKNLIAWNDLVKDYQEEEIIATEFLNDQYVPYLIKNGSLQGFNNPKVKLNYIESVEFENMILYRRNSIATILKGSKDDEILNAIDKIIELTKEK